MTPPVARAHGWLFWVAALIFGVAAPVGLLGGIGLLGSVFGLVDQQAQLLVLTASGLLLAAAPLGPARPMFAALAAGGHIVGAWMALALAWMATEGALQLWSQVPVIWLLYALAPWLTAAVFGRRAWVLWRRAEGTPRRPAFAVIALLLYAPALGVGDWMDVEWRRVRPLLGSTEGADWEATLTRAWWLTRLPGLQDIELQWDYCDASADAQVRLAAAGQQLFDDDFAQDDCEYYD